LATDESPELPEHADLCALADGSLPPDRAAAVEARMAASAELRELVARQQRAVASARVLTAEPVPDSLRSSVESYRRRRTFRFAPRLALAGAVAASRSSQRSS
jgi:anti-sigma factor RsiW